VATYINNTGADAQQEVYILDNRITYRFKKLFNRSTINKPNNHLKVSSNCWAVVPAAK